MSNYGMKTGSKTYMVMKLTEIWTILNAPPEHNASASQGQDAEQDESQNDAATAREQKKKAQKEKRAEKKGDADQQALLAAAALLQKHPM